MKRLIIRMIIIFIVFFAGACSMAAVDTICFETTGHGGKLVFDVEKAWLLN